MAPSATTHAPSIMRRRHRPTYSAARSATYSGDNDGLSDSLKCHALRFSSAARSTYPVLSQCWGESGFVAAYSRAPGTDRRGGEQPARLLHGEVRALARDDQPRPVAEGK